MTDDVNMDGARSDLKPAETGSLDVDPRYVKKVANAAKERVEKARDAGKAPSVRDLRDMTLPADADPSDYGSVTPLPEETRYGNVPVRGSDLPAQPDGHLTAEQIGRLGLIPDLPPEVKVVTVGPTGRASVHTMETRGGMNANTNNYGHNWTPEEAKAYRKEQEKAAKGR